ncbi:unnamed protein product [Ilex paraguariensis]|uniref:Uncharacterized protein n=1 Tax=Ilex paraguariensis TaxID=185542 RepID=A0ABC8R118_9AQUA
MPAFNKRRPAEKVGCHVKKSLKSERCFDVGIPRAKNGGRQSTWKIVQKIGPAREDDQLAKSVDDQLSPKALRAAKLKTRFADTILKAKGKLLDQDYKDDLMRLQKEKERLQRQQREEMVKIEAQINTVERDLKLQQREREREAARIALEEIEKTVEIDDFFTVAKLDPYTVTTATTG